MLITYEQSQRRLKSLQSLFNSKGEISIRAKDEEYHIRKEMKYLKTGIAQVKKALNGKQEPAWDEKSGPEDPNTPAESVRNYWEIASNDEDFDPYCEIDYSEFE